MDDFSVLIEVLESYWHCSFGILGIISLSRIGQGLLLAKSFFVAVTF